jgi:hypothetical protein
MSRRVATFAALVLWLGACASAATSPPAPSESASQSAAVALPVGHRAKTPQGVDIVFDAERGVFAVVGRPDHWWVDQRFYRREAGGWFVAPSLEGPWTACGSGDLPRGLRAEGQR